MTTIKKYESANKKEIIQNLQNWLTDNLYFTTCYKARAVGVFVQYEIPDKSTDAYLYSIDQGKEDVLNYVSGWLTAIYEKEVVFKIEEREKVGFSIYITLKRLSEIEVFEDEIPEGPVLVEPILQPDSILKDNEKRSIEEIVATATATPISRLMSSDSIVIEETVEGIKRMNLPAPKVSAMKINEKKQVGRKAEYNWDKLVELHKQHNGSMTKIAKDLGCSVPAVRRQVEKFKKERKL